MIEAEILHTWNSWQSPWLVLHTAILHTEEQDCHTHVSCRGRSQHWHHQCGCKVSTVTMFQNVHPLSDSSSRNKQNRKAYLRLDSSFTQPLYSAVHEGLAFSHQQQQPPRQRYIFQTVISLYNSYSCITSPTSDQSEPLDTTTRAITEITTNCYLSQPCLPTSQFFSALPTS